MNLDSSDVDDFSAHSLPLELAREIDQVCDEFSAELRAGKEPRIEDSLGRVDETGRAALLCELIVTELEFQLSQGRCSDAEAYYSRFPNDRPAVTAAFGRLKVMADAPREAAFPLPAAPSPGRTASHNLLFGIIALQNDFVTREALVAGFDAWVHDKSRTLAEVLQSQGALSAEDREILERLVGKFLEKHGGDPEQSLAALSAISQVRPELEQLHDADLSVSLGHVGASAGPDSRFASTMPFTEGSPRGRFRILRPHAKGGLGQVSVALDQDLNREVALKEIQPKHADNAAARERFLLEAEITGGLEHPGIVPVYALGQGPDGRPFYAMRFVKGDSLKQAIEDFHRPDNPNRKEPGARQLALRQLLGRFIDVCNAMEYAHSRGVLHRDLKPGNIMVGKYGETLVVDWGLAKSVGKREIVSDEATLRPSSALSSSGQTVAGTPIGTPAYMSPEQAAGKLDELSPASDVYSLGATLYHLLCGKAPFEGKDHVEIARKVQRGDFQRPKSVVPEVPSALQAICLKAMALKTADRYQTARALSDDLEHWLADEPISAAPDKMSDRLRRLGRRHQGAVQSSGIAVIVISVVSITFAIQNAHLAGLERVARQDANNRSLKLQATLARSYFDRGVREYAMGHFESALVKLRQALAAASPEDPLRNSYECVLIDMCLRGGRQVTPPLRHVAERYISVFGVAFSPDGKRVVTGGSSKSVRLWDVKTGAPIGEEMKHTNAVFGIAFSPDASCIATASADKTARLWDAHTGTPIGEAVRHTDVVDCVAFSPDGSCFVTGSDDDTARQWDAKTGAPIGDAMKHKSAIRAVKISPDGARIVTGSHDETARLWDAKTGAPIGETMRHGEEVTSVAFSPDGTCIVTGSDDRTARLWDAKTGTPIGEAMKHEGLVRAVEFSPDGTRIVTGSHDKTARLWDVKTGAPIGKTMKHEGVVRAVAFSPDGSRVVTGSDDKTARLWDVRTGTLIGEAMRHEEAVYSVAFSPDGMQIATKGDSQSAQLWDARAGTPILEQQEVVSDLAAFSPDGTRVVTVGEDHAVRLWDAKTGTPIGEVMRHQSSVNNLIFDSQGARIVTASADNTARLWDAKTGAPIGEAMKHEGIVPAVEFSPDGTRVATASADNTARLWDAKTGAPIGETMKHEGIVRAVAFSPDGSRVVTGSDDKTARLWNAKTGASMGETMRHGSGFESFSLRAAFSPDGTRVLTGVTPRGSFIPDIPSDMTRLWDGQTGAPIGEPMLHQGRISSAEFSPDGTRVVTGSFDNTARLWNAHTGAPVGNTLRLEDSIHIVAFSPDGTCIVTVSDDNNARLWDAHTGTPVGDVMRHEEQVPSVAFSPDGTRVATGSCDNSARLWDALTGVPVAEVMRGPDCIDRVAFSANGTRIVVGGKTVRLWDTTVPDFRQVTPAIQEMTLRLWTGYRVDSDGSTQKLSLDELEEVRRELGDNDPLMRFVADRERNRRATSVQLPTRPENAVP